MSSLSQPTNLKNRIHSLDLIRGFAVLGILIMNITSFSQIRYGVYEPHNWCWFRRLQSIFHGFNYIFADTRFMSIFSMLFGAGVVLFTQRIEAKGKRVAAVALQKNVLAFNLWFNTRLFHLGRRYISSLCHLWKFGFLF
jgi:uncharacterized protein